MQRFPLYGVILCIILIVPWIYASDILYDANMSQVTIVINGNRMITFDPSQTVEDLLKSPIVIETIGKCSLTISSEEFDRDYHLTSPKVSSEGVINNNLFLFDAFTQFQPEFLCGGTVHSATKFIPTKERITKEHLDYLRDEYYRIQDDSTKEYPMEQIQMMYLNMDSAIGWVTAFLQSHWGPMRKFPDYNTSNDGKGPNDLGLYSFSGEVLSVLDSKKLAAIGKSGKKSGIPTRIAVTGDWASGTIEADYVGKIIKSQDPHYTVNIGDIYLVGTPKECNNHVLGIREKGDKFKNAVKWPIGSKGAFWFQGNHEMHSRGFGYFDNVLPAMGLVDKDSGKVTGQKASYLVLESEYFRVIGLDSGYTSYSVLYETHANPQPPSVMDWLINVVHINDPSDTRAIVMLTHHNTVSAFQGAYDATPQQINKLLFQEGINRELVWIFGHEHKTALYEAQEILPGSSVLHHPRMVGSGGFGVDCHPIPPRAREAGLLSYDSRIYRNLVSDWGSAPISYNGWSILTFVDDILTIDYYTLQLAEGSDTKPDAKKANHIITEKFIADGRGSALWIAEEYKVLDPNITIVSHTPDPETKSYRRNTNLAGNDEALKKAGFDLESYFDNVQEYNHNLHEQITEKKQGELLYNPQPLKQVTDEDYAIALILEYVKSELEQRFPEEKVDFKQIESIKVHPNPSQVNTRFKGVVMPKIEQIILKD